MRDFCRAGGAVAVTGRATAVRVAAIVCAAWAVNIAVAWACAAWAPLHGIDTLPEWSKPGYPEPWPGGPYKEKGYWTTGAGFGYRSYCLNGAHGAEGDFIYWRGGTIPYREAGWPVICLRSTVQAYYSPRAPHYPRRWQLPLTVILKRGFPTNGLPAFLHARADRRLPLVPLWPGFLANTLFFAVLFGIYVALRGGATPGRPSTD